MHIKPGERQAAAPQMATSTCAGLLDATISLNRGIQQLFPSAAIARRMLPTVFAVLRRRRQGSKTDKTSEIAVIAAGGAYGTGVLTKGRSVQANLVTILHVQPGGDHAYQETFTGIIAPSRGDYQASVAGARLLISPIAAYNYGGFGPGVVQTFGSGSVSGTSSIRVNVDNNGVTLPGMTAFALSGFASESITSAPQLTAHLRLVNGTLTGTIENHSSLTFTDAVLIAGDSFQRFGALKPGATATVSLEPKPGNSFGQPAYSRIYGTSYIYGPQPSQPTDAQREDYAKTQILSVLPTGASVNGSSTAAAPLLVAWTHQPFEDITVNGSRPRTTAETAVALSLPVDQIGTGPLPAGVVNGRIVDVVGDTQGGPPGMLVMQAGRSPAEFRGSYDVILQGTLDAKPWSFTPPGNAKPLQMKQYLRVEGIIDLPPGAVVKTLQVRVLDASGGVKAIESAKL